MPRTARVSIANTPYHVINRANGRQTIFHIDDDYRHFESLLEKAVERTNIRLLSYCVMPNHWHFVLHPENDGDLGKFMLL